MPRKLLWPRELSILSGIPAGWELWQEPPAEDRWEAAAAPGSGYLENALGHMGCFLGLSRSWTR